MAKRNITDTKSSYNWYQLVKDLSDIINKPCPRDRLFNQEIVLNPQIKNFRDEFIKNAKEISYTERKEYYDAVKLKSNDISLIEMGMDRKYEYLTEDPNDPGIINVWEEAYQFTEKLNKMISWFFENDKEFKLTRVWLYGINYEVSSKTLNQTERFYLFHKCLEYDLIGIVNTGFYVSYGDKLCRLLSLIMDVPDTSLDQLIKGLKKDNLFPTIENITSGNRTERNDIIGKKLKSLEKVINAFDNTGLSKDRIEGRNLMSYLQNLKADYKQTLGIKE